MPEVHNPNLQSQGSGGGGGGGDMRSTMAFMLLVLAVFLGYQYFFAKPKPDQQPPACANAIAACRAHRSGRAGPGPACRNAAPPSAPASAATPQITASLETETTIENELYKIVFTNRGAQVKHWILKKYFDSAGKPLDMVQQQAAARFGLPLALFTYEPALTTQINQALYQVTVTGAQPTATGLLFAPTVVSFHYAANGLDVVKTFRFDSSYVVSVEAAVKQNGAPVRALVEWPAGLGDMEEFQQSSMIRSQVPTPSYFAWSIDGKEDIAGRRQGQRKQYPRPALSVRRHYGSSILLRPSCPMCPNAPPSSRCTTPSNLPADPSDPNSKKTPRDVLGLAVGDTSGDYPPAPVRRAQGHRSVVIRSRHGCRRQARRSLARTPRRVWLLGLHRQAALLRSPLHGHARHLELGLGHHPLHHPLYAGAAAHAHHDDASRR